MGEKKTKAAKHLPTSPDLQLEIQAGHPSVRIAGVDEVGRGCLAGPVYAAAVVLPPEPFAGPPDWLHRITDSKLLTPELRDLLAPEIRAWVADYAVASATVEEVDRINIFQASLLAMERAVAGLRQGADHFLVDGKFLPAALRGRGTAIVKGDLRSLSIACASILAKVARDQWMIAASGRWPGYGFEAHKGYGTPAHLKALDALGVCELHRRSFSPVALRLKAAASAGVDLPEKRDGQGALFE